MGTQGEGYHEGKYSRIVCWCIGCTMVCHGLRLWFVWANFELAVFLPLFRASSLLFSFSPPIWSFIGIFLPFSHLSSFILCLIGSKSQQYKSSLSQWMNCQRRLLVRKHFGGIFVFQKILFLSAPSHTYFGSSLPTHHQIHDKSSYRYLLYGWSSSAFGLSEEIWNGQSSDFLHPLISLVYFDALAAMVLCWALAIRRRPLTVGVTIHEALIDIQ